ncbi:MAG: PDZ domain-containing protein [Planctomycetota bacterium]|nr:PDZ domain-containing protein [Planctomycetota bacterium]
MMKTNEMNRNNRMLISAAAALCMAAGLAAAQQVKVIEADEDDCQTTCSGERVVECEMMGDAGADGERVVIREIGFDDGQPEVKTESKMVIIQKDNDDEYKVEINGDKVKAWVNGDRVPRKQLKVTDKKVRILDDDGETIAEFGRDMNMVFSGDLDFDDDAIRLFGKLRNGNDHGIRWEHAEGDEGEMLFLPGDDEGVKFFQPEMETPPVMVGISMGSLDVDDEELYDLLDERDLDDEDVIQVIGVIDGLPADKAGLREGDVIVRLDGEWGATPEQLRDVLMDKEPGDELEVAVVRNGRFREFEIELRAYNAEKLGSWMTPDVDMMNPLSYQWSSGDEDTKRLIAELTERLAGHPNIDPEDLRVHIEALTENLRSHDQFPGRMRLDVLPRMRGMAPGEDGQLRAFVERAPRRDTVVTRGQDERLEKIEKRLERLESRIDRLLEVLERSRD